MHMCDENHLYLNNVCMYIYVDKLTDIIYQSNFQAKPFR